MSYQKDTNTLISIYDAAMTFDAWTPALDLMASSVGCVGVMIYTDKQIGSPYQLNKSNSIYIGMENIISQYMHKFGHYDAEGIKYTKKSPFLDLIYDIDIWPNLFKNEDREDINYVKNIVGIKRRIIYNLSYCPDTTCGVIFQFGIDMDDIPNPNVEIATAIVPHLAKGISINSLFCDLYCKYNAVLSVLNKINVGIAVIRRDGEIITKNSTFDITVENCEGISIRNQRQLVFLKQDIAQKYRHYANHIELTAQGLNNEVECSITLEREFDVEPVLLEMSPLRDSQDELNDKIVGCLVVLIDPLQPPPISIKPYKQYFGFTNAESDVAELLITGYSLPIISEKRSVSLDTVKSQCKAIYSKTSVSGRIGLIKKLIAISPPLALSDKL